VEKFPVKDRRLKPRIIGTGGSVIQGIEKDTGCRLKVEDNSSSGSAGFFVRISGSSRGMVGKAVDAVKKLLDQVQQERKAQASQRLQGSHNRGASAPIQRMPNQSSLHEQSYLSQDLPYYGDGQPVGMEQISQVDSRRQWEGGNQNGSFMMAPYGHKGGIYILQILFTVHL
jgi:polyribonucleotide nucleotidyltransferase